MANIGDLIPRQYSGFRGVDFRGNEVNLIRSPNSLNMWRNYKKTSSIETRPCMKLDTEFNSTIYGIFFYKGEMLVHCGDKLYKDGTELKTGLNEQRSNGFIYDDVWYFKDGKNYLQYDGTTIKDVEAFVPTTSISRKPAGGGRTYQDVNMLTGVRINTFVSDYKKDDKGNITGSNEYWLDADGITAVFEVKVNGFVIPRGKYSVNTEKGIVTFTTEHSISNANGTFTIVANGGDGKGIPLAPLTDGQDNVSIEFSKIYSDGENIANKYRNAILGCTLLQVFDNRVFFSGNKDFPNYVWHCSLNAPNYISDLDYYREGMDDSPVRGMVAGNNALWVFREPSEANTNVFYHNPTVDDDYGKIYPASHSSITIGCVGGAINFMDDIVFFSPRGMEGISGDITTEQMLGHRSTLADAKMISQENYRNMLLEEWEGYLLVFIDNKVFLADSRATFSNEGHYEYEWFMWELEENITAVKVHNGTLYLGTDKGVYKLVDEKADIEAWWTTPLDKFDAPNKQKTTNKRGCVVEAEGDVSVYVKTDKESEFELVETFNDVKDSFTCRIKKKKFKDLQLQFKSNKWFRLESATIESFIGGYLK